MIGFLSRNTMLDRGLTDMVSRMGSDSKCALTAVDCGCYFVVNTESRPKMCSHEDEFQQVTISIFGCQNDVPHDRTDEDPNNSNGMTMVAKVGA